MSIISLKDLSYIRSYEGQGAKMLQIMQFLSKMLRICFFNISAATLYTAKYVLILLSQGVSDGSSKQIMSREALYLQKNLAFLSDF